MDSSLFHDAYHPYQHLTSNAYTSTTTITTRQMHTTATYIFIYIDFFLLSAAESERSAH